MLRLNKSLAIILVALLSCALMSLRVTAQQPGRKPPAPQAEDTLKIETMLVSVPVIVSDRQGRYVSGLKAPDFTLYADRVRQSIAFFADTEEPLNVALLLDTSKSTSEALDEIKHAARDFIKHLRPQDRALVVSFDCDVQNLSSLTADRQALERAIDNARIGERAGTKLRDAVSEVMTRQFKTLKGRKAIVLLTDGKDHGSFVSESALLEEATEAETLVYSVFYLTGPRRFADARLPRETDRGPGGWRGPRMGGRGGVFTPFPRFPGEERGSGRNERRERRSRRMEERNTEAMDFLQDLAETSAGRYYRSEVTDLKKTFEQIIEELRHQYRLGFYPPDRTEPAGQPTSDVDSNIHSIKVELARRDVVVRSRRSYRLSEESNTAK